jgi:ribosomal protein S7
MYGALANIEEKMKEDPVGVFNRAVENVRPLLEVRAAPRRRSDVSGADGSS